MAAGVAADLIPRDSGEIGLLTEASAPLRPNPRTSIPMASPYFTSPLRITSPHLTFHRPRYCFTTPCLPLPYEYRRGPSHAAEVQSMDRGPNRRTARSPLGRASGQYAATQDHLRVDPPRDGL